FRPRSLASVLFTFLHARVMLHLAAARYAAASYSTRNSKEPPLLRPSDRFMTTTWTACFRRSCSTSWVNHSKDRGCEKFFGYANVLHSISWGTALVPPI